MEAVSPAVRPANPSRAWFQSSIADFLPVNPNTVLGQLTAHSDFAVLPAQRDAWLEEIAFLQSELAGLSGGISMEFSIPRMGRRVDTVLIVGSVLFVVEFKVGGLAFDRAAVEQVWD